MKLVFAFLVSILFYILRIFRIKPYKIVISNYNGKGYGDNAKYIVDYLLKHNNVFDIVWLSNNKKNSLPNGVRSVYYHSFQSIYELVTAHFWIDNRRKPYYVRKRNGQFYIMTWHSNIALKKVERDVKDRLSSIYVKAAQNDSKMIDFFLSGSRWETNCIKRAFWYEGKVLDIGYPRQDIFVQNDTEKQIIIKGIKSLLGINQGTKILLYAPTFRKAQNYSTLSNYKLEWNNVLNAMSNKFGGEWVGLIRLHPNVSQLAENLIIPQGVIDVSSYNDMQELILATDCLITDYSSTIIEAGIANKIGFIFALDYIDYKKDRDVYFDLKDDLPFPFADSNKGLIDAIMNFDISKYYQDLSYFLYTKYGVICNGTASEQVAMLMKKIIQ